MTYFQRASDTQALAVIPGWNRKSVGLHETISWALASARDRDIEINETSNTIKLATELTIAWLGNPNTRADADAVPAFLHSMHAAVNALAGDVVEPASEQPAEHVAAVSVRKSLASNDHIISMIDGKPYKTLRRHLSTHGLTPEEYRTRYNLKADYPMVAQGYSEARRDMAKKIGLGRKPSEAVAAEAPATEPKRRGRKPAQTEAA